MFALVVKLWDVQTQNNPVADHVRCIMTVRCIIIMTNFQLYSVGCEEDEFQCPDGTCFPIGHLCDNITDCSDGYDELNCTGEQISNVTTSDFGA